MSHMEAYKAYKPSFRRTEYNNTVSAFPTLHNDAIGNVVKPRISRHNDTLSTAASVGVVVRYKQKSQVRTQPVYFFVKNDVQVRFGNL